LKLLLLLHHRRRAAKDAHRLVVESLHRGIEVNRRRLVCPIVQLLRHQDQRLSRAWVSCRLRKGETLCCRDAEHFGPIWRLVRSLIVGRQPDKLSAKALFQQSEDNPQIACG
jgi:hypothetical protein